MKTTINLLLSAKLTQLLQQAFGRYCDARVNYSFQPLPSYWAMVPHSRDVIIQAQKK